MFLRLLLQNLMYSEAMAFIMSELKHLKCQNVWVSFDILTMGQITCHTGMPEWLSKYDA